MEIGLDPNNSVIKRLGRTSHVQKHIPKGFKSNTPLFQ